LKFGLCPNLKKNKSHVQETSFAAEGGVIGTQILNEPLYYSAKVNTPSVFNGFLRQFSKIKITYFAIPRKKSKFYKTPFLKFCSNFEM
jgi:hypothetical protein